MTTTGTRVPQTESEPPAPPSWINRGGGGDDGDNDDTPNAPSNTHKINWGAWAIVAAAMIVATLAITFVITRGDDGAADREVTRSKAEAVLRARFNDTSGSVGPLQTIKVEWVGDQLVATWTQGEAAQKRCTAPVLISANGQNFGIAAFEPVPFDKQSAAPANCVVTAGLEYGFPLEE